MRLDKLTIKAQEALQEAQALVQKKGHQRLEPEVLNRIVDLQVARAQNRLADRRVTLKLTAHAKSFLAGEGFDPIYGARPLRRAVQKYVVDLLAMRLLNGSLKAGQTVTVDQSGEKTLSFKSA